MVHPTIIQGGMGVAVSNWRLARAVSQLGQLGVVSGTLLAVVLARRLAQGDLDGHVRRALAAFPYPAVATRILSRYFVEGGLPDTASYRAVPMPTIEPSLMLNELIVAANFVEVWLAKEGHSGRVGINLLEKIQVATLPSLYGAMLAGVDYVLMGAGIPRSIPGVLDQLASGTVATLKIDVEGTGPGEEYHSTFDPAMFGGDHAPVKLPRPYFLAIVSSATLALTLARKSNGRVDGFVVEGSTAGGHNAPPRGTMQLSVEGEPIYGPRDAPDLAKFRELGLPFWLAGSQGRCGQLDEARRQGAVGIQVGTPFAFCDESGVEPALKEAVLRASRSGHARVFTDPAASPTGFPFKVLELPGTLSDPVEHAARERICDLGYLRQPYKRDDGTLGYRCAAEPVEDYVRKGGTAADAAGRKCLCNTLAATVGLAQRRAGGAELPLVTAGNDVTDLSPFLRPDGDHYTAAEVIQACLAEQPTSA